MGDFTVYDPLRVYQHANDNTCELFTVFLSAGVGNNIQVVPAVTGKAIRFMGAVTLSASTTPGIVAFKDANGGVGKFYINAPSNANPNFILPVINSGYYNTGLNNGIYVDVLGTTCNFSVQYIVFTP